METKETITIAQVEMRENETEYYKQLNNSLAEMNKIKKNIINSLATDIKQTKQCHYLQKWRTISARPTASILISPSRIIRLRVYSIHLSV